MDIIAIIMLTFAATADSLIIGFNYGVRQVRIGHLANIFISILCFAGTYLAMLSGRFLAGFFSVEFADLIGNLVLTGFGLWLLFSCLRPKKTGLQEYSDNPDVADRDRSRVIELRESFMIGLMLTLNNMGLGIGAGIAGISVLITPLLCALASFLFIYLGSMLGKKLSKSRLSFMLEFLAAVLVLILGIIGLIN